MARKPSLTADKLKDLGEEKLAQLVLDEAERNTGFRRQVKAALAGKSGPEAIAKLMVVSQSFPKAGMKSLLASAERCVDDFI